MNQDGSSVAYKIISSHEFAEVREMVSSGQKALYATHTFSAGDPIISFSSAKTVNTPNYLTVQVNNDEHIMLHPEFIQYINHSCEPNCFFDTTNMQLIALTDILSGAAFTFFYPSTEWDMQQPFACCCGSKKCLGEIRGAAHLSSEQANQYRFTDFILSKRNNIL